MKPYDPLDWPRCCGCKTNPETMDLAEAIQMLKSCNNCKADINMAGEWTGYGKEALVVLFRRFGFEATDAAWQGEQI